MKCNYGNSKDEQELEAWKNHRNVIYDQMKRRSHHRCNDCYFRLIVHRVRINRIVTTAHQDKTAARCLKQWGRNLHKRDRILEMIGDQDENENGPFHSSQVTKNSDKMDVAYNFL